MENELLERLQNAERKLRMWTQRKAEYDAKINENIASAQLEIERFWAAIDDAGVGTLPSSRDGVDWKLEKRDE